MQNKSSGISLAFRWNPVKPLPGKPLPRSRSRHCSCRHGDCIYVIGGKDGRVSLKDIWRFRIDNGEWEKITLKGDVPSYLEGHTLVSHKKNLLLFGGSFGDDVTDSALWIINPDVQHVRQVSCEPGFPQPCTRRHHSAVVHDGVMYVYGGHIDLKGSSSEMWAFHIAEEEWELMKPRQQRGDMPEGRHGHSAVMYGRDMWVYGGTSGLTPKADLWYFNFHVGKWTRMKCRFGPPPLVGHAAVVVKDTMLLQGGEQNGELSSDFWIFSFGSLKWTHIEIPNQVPSPRMWHSLEAITCAVQKSEGSTRTSSMPYLQNKQGRRQTLRPRSSPAYSSARVAPKQSRDRGENSREKGETSVATQRPHTLELKPIRAVSDSLPVVMRTPVPKKKEEKSPLLLERHISQCSAGSEGSLKGADNLGLDISNSCDRLSSLEIVSRQVPENSDHLPSLEFKTCQAFTESYGYHQKPPEKLKAIKMQTFDSNVIKVLPYPQVAQDLVVEDLEIYENYFSDLRETALVKVKCHKTHFVGQNKKYKVNQSEGKNLPRNYRTVLDRAKSSSVGELVTLSQDLTNSQSKLRSYSLHNLKKDPPVLCWQSLESDSTEDIHAHDSVIKSGEPDQSSSRDQETEIEMSTTSFCETEKSKDSCVSKERGTYVRNPQRRRQKENHRESSELSQPYLLLFGGKDMKGGSVRMESLTTWRCEVFLRHSDISHGEYHKYGSL
uniref:Uncharacterized protein LOC111113768 isoform X2 n=1 Tax=Crassostrea virginica TaxID=6565 RepID=A0A8B8BWU8_CRAVI|nr:uncharacterized protein LOC111113768 isoform X2 [Crassostrea virginica]